LSFLNAQAALDALPRIVDIMADEFGWSYSERKKQISKAFQFLGSMGLPPTFMTSAFIPEPEPRGILEHIEKALWKACTGVVHVLGFSTIESQRVYGRSKFEGGEVVGLRNAFISNAHGGAAAAGELKLKTGDILEILKDVAGYSEITKKELNYVLDEAGLKGQGEVDLDQFIEVRPRLLFLSIRRLLLIVAAFPKICGNLKEVALAPTPVKGSKARRSIPVEKSGGGV
jgi:glycerol-3-phosphate dehydrogenase